MSRDQPADFSERRRAELHEIERFRNLVEQAADGIFVLEEGGSMLEVNEAGARMLGMSREEVVGRSIIDLVAPEERPNSTRTLEELRTGTALTFERMMRRKDGSVFPAEVSAKRLSDGRIQGILRDITVRKQAQEALRTSEERFRNLTAAAFEGIGITEGGRIVDVNEQFARMYHCTREEMIGCEVWTLVAPESRVLVAEHIQRGFDEPYEHRAIRKDGTIFDVEAWGRALDWGGRRVRVTAVRDVTGRKRAEAALRESEQRLSLIFQNTSDPVALYSVEDAGRYRLLAVNPAFLEVSSQRLGRSVTPEQIIGRWFDELEILQLDPAAVAAAKRGLDEAVATRQVVRWEDRQSRPTGRFVSERTDIPILDDQGRCRHVMRVVRDITAQTRAEEERTALLERMGRQAEALLRYSLDPAVTGGDVPQAARHMTEMAADTLQVERASIWMLEPDGHTLNCLDRYKRSFAEHVTTDFRLDMANYGEALAGITEGRSFATTDIAGDSRTAALAKDLAAFAVGLGEETPRSALTTAVRVRGKLAGVVWMATVGEPKLWLPDEIAFCAALGDHFAQALLNADREQAARDLRSLAAQLMATEDAERRRIARELHDSTGQLLAALEINMVMLSRSADTLSARSRALLEDCIAQTKHCSDSIRTASYLLHPPLLDEMGLVSAIRWHLDGFCHRSGIAIATDLPPHFERMPPEDELSLFRIVQEALTNIHRHSGAKSARISLQHEGPEVALTITDDGHGMALESLTRFRDGQSTLGIGLAGMRERLRQLGGRLEIQSDAHGTRLAAILPFRRAADESRSSVAPGP